MDKLKAFFIRTLQVIWVLSVVIMAAVISLSITQSQDVKDVLIGCFAWIVFLIIIQYLVFASINPSWLFGENKGRYFFVFTIISIALSVVCGVGIKAYDKHEYNKKLEAGADTVFFNKILSDTIDNYDLTECDDIDSLPAASKKDLQAAASKLEAQNTKGLNILVKIAKQDDALGRRFRCLINEDIDLREVAQIANVKF